MPVDLKNKPEEDSGIYPDGWYRHESDPLEDAYNAESAKDSDLPAGHPSRSDTGAAVSNKELAAAETSGRGGGKSTSGDAAESNQLGGFYSNKDSGKGRGRLGKFFGSKKGKWIGVGVGGGVAGITISGFFLLPLKTLHIADNLQETFFSSSEEAAEDMTNRLVSSYIIQKVMPGMSGTCPSTSRSKSCAVVNQNDTVVSQLYAAWRDNNLEGKMAEKHGIEFRREGNKFYMYKNGQTIFSEIFDERNPRAFENKMFAHMDRKQIRKEMLKAIENETFYKRIMYRFKYGSLMERKYGVIRCVIACDYRQDRADRKELRKMKMKAWVIHRVIGPLNEGYALAFECAVASFDCAKESDATVNDDGTKQTKFENDLRERTKTAIGDGRMTQERLAQLQSDAGDIRDNGLSSFLLKQILGEAGGRLTGSVVGGLGLVDVLASLVQGISEAGPAIKVMNYAMKSGAAVQVYSMIRTNGDEIKAGNIHAEELGYVADSLGDDFGEDQGGRGAEATPYFQDIMGSQGVSTASLFPKAHAAAPYKCDDGSTLATGLCPEMSMAATTSGANAVRDLGSVFDKYHLTDVAAVWNSTIGRAFDALNNFIGIFADIAGDLAGALTPGFIQDKAADIAKAIAEWFTSKLFVSFMTTDTSGGRMFEAAALGANVAGNDYAHYGLGAGKISDQTANEIRYARALEKKQAFMEKPMFARMFDTSDSHSTISRLALAMPNSTTATARSLSSTLLNPFSIVSSSLTSTKKVDAAPKEDLDLGGVTQYGYTGQEDIFSQTNYEEYWRNNNCDDDEQMKAWGQSATLSSTNGSFVNDTPYPCKLLASVVAMNGAYYSDDFLTTEELGDTGADSVPNPTSPTEMRVGSFNILHPPDGDVMARLQRSMRVIMQDHSMDIVGLQEARQIQQEKILSTYAGEGKRYSMYPNRAGVNPESVILYNNDKFELVSGREESIKYEGNRSVNIARFRSKETGAEFYFMNTHDPINRRAAGSGPENRRFNAEKYARLIEGELSDLPVVLVGDFNSNYKSSAGGVLGTRMEGLAYCILTKSGKMWNATDAQQNKRGACPSQKDHRGENRPDHIYISTTMQADNFGVHRKGQNVHQNQHVNGSDHDTIYVDVTLPGSGSAGWSWPLKRNINPGPCYGGTNEHAGMDMNSETDSNPVYAMHSGKVVRKAYDNAAGNFVTILADAEFNGKKVYYSYEHLKTGSVNVAVGDRVEGGRTVIGIAGLTGNVDVTSSLAHLHIVTATTNSLGAYGNLGTTFDPMDILKDAGPPPEGYQCTVSA